MGKGNDMRTENSAARHASLRGSRRPGAGGATGGRLVVAVPAAAAPSGFSLEREADEVIALMVPEEFYAVGQCYENFSQTSAVEVTALLAKAGHATQCAS